MGIKWHEEHSPREICDKLNEISLGSEEFHLGTQFLVDKLIETEFVPGSPIQEAVVNLRVSVSEGVYSSMGNSLEAAQAKVNDIEGDLPTLAEAVKLEIESTRLLKDKIGGEIPGMGGLTDRLESMQKRVASLGRILSRDSS